MQRRVENASPLALAGRLRARVVSGHVAMRWHDGVRFAEAEIANRAMAL
jgi:hypothetical protein